MPPSNVNGPCANATGNLFDPNDTCSRTVLEVFNGNDSSITDLFVDDCPTRFHAYVTSCDLNDVSVNITIASYVYTYTLILLLSLQALELANLILALSQTSASNGRSCSEILPLFISMEDEEVS